MSVGKLARICSKLSPSARLASTVRNGTRVPRNRGWPPQIAGLRSKASSNIAIAVLSARDVVDTLPGAESAGARQLSCSSS